MKTLIEWVLSEAGTRRDNKDRRPYRHQELRQMNMEPDAIDAVIRGRQ